MRDAKKWSYSAGERGRNRVRAFEHPATGLLFLEWYQPRLGRAPKRERQALGHRDRARAKQQADEMAAQLGKGKRAVVEALTVRQLIDRYVREQTPRKGESKQRHDHRAATMFVEFFGADRPVAMLTRQDWERFIDARRRGVVRSGARVGGRPVRANQVRYDLTFLRAALRWATTAPDGRGGVLLERDPLQGCAVPREESPARPVLDNEQYEALLAAAERVSPQFRLALILAHETGHRIGAIQQLRWSDIDRRRGVIRWRAETDKTGRAHETPLPEAAATALDGAQRDSAAIGDSWVLPDPTDPSKPVSRHLLWRWWDIGETVAGIEHVEGLGYHALRRKFALELKNTPLRDLCELGGWKDPQTVLRCYQRADDETMRAALAGRRRLGAGRLGTDTANRHHATR